MFAFVAHPLKRLRPETHAGVLTAAGIGAWSAWGLLQPAPMALGAGFQVAAAPAAQSAVLLLIALGLLARACAPPQALALRRISAGLPILLSFALMVWRLMGAPGAALQWWSGIARAQAGSGSAWAEPLTLLGLACAGAALWPQLRPRPLLRNALRVWVPLAALALLGVHGLVWNLLFSTDRYGLPAELAVPPLAACIFVLLAWVLHRDRDGMPIALRLSADHRITLMGMAILTGVAGATGLATFAVLQARLQQAERQRVTEAQYRREIVFSYQLRGAASRARAAALREGLMHATRERLTGRDGGEALRAELASLRSEGMTAVRVETEGRGILAQDGEFLATVAMNVTLEDWPDTALQWGGGLSAFSRVPIFANRSAAQSGTPLAPLAWLVVRDDLELMTHQLFDAGEFGSTGKMALCAPAIAAGGTSTPSAIARCFPLTRDGPVYVAPDEWRTSLALAFSGDSGVREELDSQGRRAIVAYSQMMSPLGLVVRQDVQELMEPVRDKLELALLAVATLMVGGIAALHFQLRPLARQLVLSEQAARQATDELAERERNVRAVMNNVGEAIVTFALDGQIRSCNPAAEVLFGMREAVLVSRSMRDLLPGYATPEGRFPTDAARELSVRLRPRAESFVSITTTESWVREQHLFIAVLRDVSERRRHEAEIHAEKERFRVTLASIGDGVIATDARGIVTYLNLVAEAMTGRGTGQALGRPLSEVAQIFDGRQPRTGHNPIDEALRTAMPIKLSGDLRLVRHGDGREFAIDPSVAPIRNEAGETHGVVLAFHDVTEARQLAAEMTYQATHDSLTGLANRKEFERRMQEALRGGQVDRKTHCLLYIDLDKFKIVNDTCGHAAGDALLRQLSALMGSALRDADTLARLGGDEFAVMLPGCTLEAAMALAECLRAGVAGFRFSWQERIFSVGASIGVVSFTCEGQPLSAVLRDADAACYEAKRRGRNTVHVHSAQTALAHAAIAATTAVSNGV